MLKWNFVYYNYESISKYVKVNEEDKNYPSNLITKILDGEINKITIN